MKNKTTETVEKTVTQSITCDICGKTYSLEDDIMEVQEFYSIRNVCGYGAVYGDGELVELDMCQYCLKEKLGEFVRITPEE